MLPRNIHKSIQQGQQNSKLLQVDQSQGHFMLSALTGENLGISKEHKKLLSQLYMNHLLSPSALHIIPILFLVNIFLKDWYFILFLIASFLYGGYWCHIFHPAITRYLQWETFKNIKIFFQLKFSNSALFLIVFMTDYFIGTARQGLNSYIYSFIILGHLVIAPFEGFYLNLLAAQLLISFFNTTQKFNIIEFGAGQIGTFLFLPVYLFNVAIIGINHFLKINLISAETYESVSFIFWQMLQKLHYLASNLKDPCLNALLLLSIIQIPFINNKKPLRTLTIFLGIIYPNQLFQIVF